MDFAKFMYGPWEMALAKYQRGELQRPELIGLLYGADPIPPDARQMLADVLANDGPALRQGAPRDDRTLTQRMMAVAMVRHLEGFIRDPGTIPDDCEPEARAWIKRAHQNATFKNRARQTARQQAKEAVAARCGVTVRALETWLRELPQ